MPRPQIKRFVDLGIKEHKLSLIKEVGLLDGVYEVDITPRRPQRSGAQNRWYWTICTSFAEYLSDQDYEITTAEMAHEILKDRFLRVDVVNPATGEVIGCRVRSTTELTTEQMAVYCERVRSWLADFFNLYIPDPA